MNDGVIYKTDNSEINIDHLYTVGGYATYHVTAVSTGFRGHTNFCVAIESIAVHVNNIDSMLHELCGNIVIQDCESDSYLKLYFSNSRKMIIQGQMGGSHESHMMKFDFEVDQTILVGLKKELKYE